MRAILCTILLGLYLAAILFSVGNPAYMSDETKELTLRVHDECTPALKRQRILSTDHRSLLQVMAPTFLGLTFARASHISSMPLRNASMVLSEVVLVL